MTRQALSSGPVTKALGRLSDYLEDARRLKAGMGAGARGALRAGAHTHLLFGST